jgi:hypothetical protein
MRFSSRQQAWGRRIWCCLQGDFINILPFYHHTSFYIFFNSNLSLDFHLFYDNFPFFVYFVGNFIRWDKIGSKIIDDKISPRH